MTTCTRCNQEITKDDERKGNFRENLYGEIVHQQCPNTLKCHICGQPVKEGENAGTAAWPRHSECHLSQADDQQADPSSWIVRKR